MCHDSAMAGMPMPGGWTMSSMWMVAPGQSWPGAASSFLGMWIAMMAVMMLPVLIPMLARYRRAVVAGPALGEVRLGGLTAVVSAGYYFAWALLGLALFPLGAGLAAVAMRYPWLAREVPLAAGLTVLIAGAVQLSAWKARTLACCRGTPGPGRTLPAGPRAAWRHGLRLGLHCVKCCAAPTAMLLALGVMNVGAMVAVTGLITLERVAPAGERFARLLGIVAIAGGVFLIVRAAGMR
jgi:predicted metal-binding membrane protein